MNKTQYFLRKHSPTILTVMGSAGVIGTAVLAVKATPKALVLLNDAENKKGDKLTTAEIIKAAWKPYIPAALVGTSTIACIFGANYLNTKHQASLMSAYALLDSTFKDYREKVKEIHGKEADVKIKQEIAASKFDENMELQDDKLLFFDYQSIRFFESTMDQVLRAENEFLELIQNRGYACMNDYYDILGIPRVDYGYDMGWYDYERIDPYGCEELEFNYEFTTMKTGEECWIIDVNIPPTDNYIM